MGTRERKYVRDNCLYRWTNCRALARAGMKQRCNWKNSSSEMITGEDEGFFLSQFFDEVERASSNLHTLRSWVTHFCSPSVVRSVDDVLEPLTPKNKVPAGDVKTPIVFAKAVSAMEVGLPTGLFSTESKVMDLAKGSKWWKTFRVRVWL